MKTKTILFCLSSHGFGHLTRTMAIIDDLLKVSDSNIIIICGSKQISFAKQYYQDYLSRVQLIEFITDIGFINRKDTLQVDVSLLNHQLSSYIEEIENQVYDLSKTINLQNIKLIATDISIVGPILGEILNIPVIGISNFTWVDQYEHIGIDKEVVSFFLKWYQKMSKMFVYGLHLDQSRLMILTEKIGFISRAVNQERVFEINKEYEDSIFISCGKSANLPEMVIDFPDGTVFYTEGIQIKTNGRAVLLPIDISDTQNYIAASSFIISKAGWGTISEALISGTPMILMNRPEVLEDSWIINYLLEMNKCITIDTEDLALVDVGSLQRKMMLLDKMPVPNEAIDVARKLINEIESI